MLLVTRWAQFRGSARCCLFAATARDGPRRRSRPDHDEPGDLGYRCCSDVTGLPEGEQRALVEGTRPRVFDAYVNVGSLGPTQLLQLAKIHPDSKFIATTTDGKATHDDDGDYGRAHPRAHENHERSPVQSVLSSLDNSSTRCLILPAGHHDKWQLLTEFLGCDYPSHSDRFRRREIERQRATDQSERTSRGTRRRGSRCPTAGTVLR